MCMCATLLFLLMKFDGPPNGGGGGRGSDPKLARSAPVVTCPWLRGLFFFSFLPNSVGHCCCGDSQSNKGMWFEVIYTVNQLLVSDFYYSLEFLDPWRVRTEKLPLHNTERTNHGSLIAWALQNRLSSKQISTK